MKTHSIRLMTVAASLGMVCLGVRALPAASQAQAQAKAPAVMTFASPQQAVDAIIQAAGSGVPALLAILDPGGKDLVDTGDPVQDQKDRADFIRLAKEKMVIVKDPADAHRAKILIGNDGFPFAIPLVDTGGKWKWDAEEGRYEVLIRRVGSNELDTISVCRGYVEAQLSYAAMNPDNTGVHQYAQQLISTPGKHDGLYWKDEPSVPQSPLSEAVARAIAEGYTTKSEPYHGYYYKILTAQGKSAPLGEMDFVVQGHMIGGFALVAWPAQYPRHRREDVHRQQFRHRVRRISGADTVKIASAMTRYDPDKTWTVTNDGK